MTAAGYPATHYLYYDYIRTYSITAVVILHVATRTVQAFPEPGMVDWWFANILDSACRWGVPCFIMLSGSLLLTSHTGESSALFFKKRMHRIGVPLLFWFTIYFVWLSVWHRQGLTLRFIVKSLIFWGPYYHLYFFYIIIPLYCITPLLRTRIRTDRIIGLKTAGLLFLLLGMTNSLIFCMKNSVRFPLQLPLLLHFFFSVLGYLGYYIAGYFIAKIVVSPSIYKRTRFFFIIACAATALGTFVLCILVNTKNPLAFYMYDYFSPTCVIMTFCIFLMIKGWHSEGAYGKKMNRFNHWVREVFSPATFGIFLVHPIVLGILEKFLPLSATMNNYAMHLSPWIRIPLLTVMTVCLSLLTIIFIKKIPYLKSTTG